MTYFSRYKRTIYIFLILLGLIVAYEIISRPYVPFLYQRDYYEQQDAEFKPEINELIKLSLPRLEEVAYEFNSKSQYLVGMRYHFGVEAFPAYDKAIMWYERSAENGEPAGMFWLSKINHTLSDQQKKELLEKSAELGYWRARRKLQIQDPSRDFENYNNYSNNEALSIPSWEHKDFLITYLKAMDLYTKKIKSVEPEKRMHERYKIESSDDQLMLDLFKTASLGGNGDAQYWLGSFYKKHDLEQSERWFKHSAFNKNDDAYGAVSFLQSSKFFAKEELYLSRNYEALLSSGYLSFEKLLEDKKKEARISYFWDHLNDEHDGFNYDLWFYERWPIERIAKECKTSLKFNNECLAKFNFGVNFGYTFLTEINR